MTMRICHEGDSEVCADAMTELRSMLEREVLAHTDASYANARHRWEPVFEQRPVAAPTTESRSNMIDFSQYGRGARVALARRAPVTNAPRTERNALMNEIERLLAEDQPELAADRFLRAILCAGLAATLAVRAGDSQQHATPEPAVKSVLTRREREIAALIAAGRTNRSIANELFIAQSTVERHVANMLNKLGYHSRAQIAAWSVTNGVATA
jgi:DNA-binding CsgD family transcriptional regulator